MLKKIVLTREFFLSVGVYIALLFFGIETIEATSYSIIFYIIVQIISGKDSFPVFQLMLLFPWLQWVIAPIASFYFPSDNQNYNILQSKAEYLSFALPGTIAYSIGLFVFYHKKVSGELVKNLTGYEDYRNGKRGVYLMVIGAICYMLRGKVPDGLNFVLFLLGGLGFVGSYYVIFSTLAKVKKLLWVIGVHVAIIVQNVIQGSFQEMVLWGLLLLLFLPFLTKLKTAVKWAIFGGGFILVSVIQAVKADYRTLKDSDIEGGSVGLFLHTVESQDVTSEVFGESNLQKSIVRYNQGWIISRILEHTPDEEPYAGGETVKDAVIASIFPRVLMEGKSESGGAKNFPRFTGLTLIKTSMDLSPLGEAYANYGKEGAYVFLFFFGMFISYVISTCIRLALKHRIEIIFWLPLIILQALKAESDIATSLNHITKAALLAYILLRFFLKTPKKI